MSEIAELDKPYDTGIKNVSRLGIFEMKNIFSSKKKYPAFIYRKRKRI